MLRDIELELKNIREKDETPFSWFNKYGLSKATIESIEGGSEYNVKSLFKYMSLLNVGLECSDVTDNLYSFIFINIHTMGDLGKFFSLYRKIHKIKAKELSAATGLNAQQFCAVEKGGNYRRRTLVSYISKINVSIKVKPYTWN